MNTLFSKQTGGSSQTIVLLHGFGGIHGVWDAISARFAASNTVIAYDLPGHGHSLAFGAGSSAKSAARGVLADLTARGIERAHIVGHSLGGAVATLTAAIQPAAVASLTLLAPGGYGEKINGLALRDFALARTGEELHAAIEAMSAPGAAFETATIDVLEQMRRAQGQTERLVEIAAAISTNDRQGTFPPDMIAGLTMAVSVLWGTADPVLGHDQAEKLPPSFRLTSIDGAGHMLIEECREAVIASIQGSISPT